MKPITVLAFALCMCISNISYAQSCKLTINISGFRNDKGVLYISLYNTEDGYPKEAKKAFRISYGAISNGKCSVLFDVIPKGTYAVACYHDENKNGKLDTNFLGIPKEGTGASNDAKGFMGPPKFSDAKFDVNGNTTQEIKINY